MDKCSNFLLIIHILSCCISVLKCLTMKNAVFPVRFVLYANRNSKETKNLVVKYLLFKDACIFFSNFLICVCDLYQSHIVSSSIVV